MASHVQLHFGASFDGFWNDVASEWFRDASSDAWRSEKPWAVLMPSRAAHAAVKTKLLEANIPLAAVRFWLPGDARRHLLAQRGNASPLPVREHLHLVLAAMAARNPSDPTYRSISREPSRLLRTLDQLSAAGVAPDVLNVKAASALAKEFAQELEKIQWHTVQATDWSLFAEPPAPCIDRLLVWGFNAAHWSIWPLLSAATRSASHAEILLTNPRVKAEALDQAWVGTWEQAFGESAPGDDADAAGPFRALVERMETPDVAANADEPDATVLIGRNLAEESRAITARIAGLVAEGGHGRIGVLFDGPGPLSREVAARLSASGIEHYDGLGHTPRVDDDSDRLNRWIAYQRSQGLATMRAVVAVSATEDERNAFEQLTGEAFNHVLSDDPKVLFPWIRHQKGPLVHHCFNVFTRLGALNPSDEFSKYIDRTKKFWDQLGWTSLIDRLEHQAASVVPLHAYPLTRGMMLDWLEAACSSTTLERDKTGSHPLAHVQLLPYAMAEDLPWEHLILTGMNDGCWPPRVDAPAFLSEVSVTELNRVALSQGSQGEGHLTARAGRTLLLGPGELRTIARRQFYNLVEGVKGTLTLTASLEGDGAEGRVLPASDLLSHLYFVHREETLNDPAMLALQEATAAWLRTGSEPYSLQPNPLQPPRIAYDARRELAPFGPYDFARTSPPIVPLTLPCKTWQGVLQDPAGIFLERILQVEPRDTPEDDDRSVMARGIWVHAWLKDAVVQKSSERMMPRRNAAEMASKLHSVANSTRGTIQNAYSEASRSLPDWWTSNWEQALWLADRLVSRLTTVDKWPYAMTEWKLPSSVEIALPNGKKLRLAGRIDLVLGDREDLNPDGVYWVMDFKTGGDSALKDYRLLKDLANGDGVQIGLYTLALRALGAGHVGATLLTPKAPAEIQVTSGAFEAQKAFWSGLARIQDTAIFGMRNELRPEYGQSPMLPLATLEVPPDLLDARWALTHPDLCVPESEDES